MGELGYLRRGEEFTIAGVFDTRPDPRWWPRFCCWVLRRPPPRLSTGLLQRFRVTEVL